MNTETNRHEFEEWVITKLEYSVSKYRLSEEYLSDAVEVAWKAWQAARERQWMPIETAPKDKIEILAWSKRHGVNVGILTHYKRPEMPSRKGGWFLPTYWMPLLNPPTSEKL